MKVLQISQYYAPHLGGVEKHLHEINQQLLAQGHQLTVLTGDDRKNFPKEEVSTGIKVFRLNNQSGCLYKLKVWRQILAKLKLFIEADVIQIHDVFWWILPIYPLIARKLFITFHGYEGDLAPSKKAVFWHRLAWKLSRGSIAVGGFHQQFYGVRADAIIFGASDLSLKKNNAKNKNSIIFVGRLAADNGIIEYLQAIKILQEQGFDYHLTVYGSGPLEKAAKEYVRKHQLSVIFAGQAEKADQLFNQYPLAFVSRYLAMIEALKSGCQVIAHYQNRIKKQYLESSPFQQAIFIERQPQQIAELIARKLSKPALSKTLSDQLTWKEVTKTYLNLWQKKF